MAFDDINVSEKMKRRLEETARSGKVSHAYIFEGNTCIDKERIALSFIKAMLCREHRGKGCDECLICRKIGHGNYEDLIEVRAEGNSIKDEAIESMQERLRNKPLGERNVVLIANADTMTLRAQNRLLKTLEEPPTAAVMILLSENAENLIATIRSRCIIRRFTTAEAGAEEDMQLLAREMADLIATGAPFYALTAKMKPAMEDKSSALAFLDALEMQYGFMLKEHAVGDTGLQQYIFRAVDSIEKARGNLRSNIGIGYVLKCLVLKIGG